VYIIDLSIPIGWPLDTITQLSESQTNALDYNYMPLRMLVKTAVLLVYIFDHQTYSFMPIDGHLPPRSAAPINSGVYRTHYAEKVTLEQLSYDAGLDLKLLQKVFAHIKGTTIHQYQLESRLEKIKQGLHELDWSLEGIARKLGFGSPKYFYRFF
jgi:AraC-like DNA-binding protein